MLSRNVKRPSPWLYVLASLLVGLWVGRAWLLIQDGGLFRVFGGDYSMAASQALMLRSGESQSIYDLERLDGYVQPLRAYTTDPTQPLAVGPVAYPPVFAWLLEPFTLVPPPLGLGLWTAVNLLGVGYLAWRVVTVVPGANWLLTLLVLLGSFPVALGLVVGQPTALLGCAMAECYVSLRAGRDFRAGLWLSALLLKPQYGLLLGPILIWKRRWYAVLGVALGGALLFGVSVVLVGLPTLLKLQSAVSDMSSFGGGALVSPGQMVNWRGLILNLRPSIGATTGLWLTLGLGGLTAAVTLWVWRGPWSPASTTFPPRMAVLALATILANYHSHAHGLTLFTVPLAASFGQPGASRLTRWSLLALACAPTIVIIGLDHWLLRAVIERQQVDFLIWSPLVQILLVVASGSLAMSILSGERVPQPGARAFDEAGPPDRSSEHLEESLLGN